MNMQLTGGIARACNATVTYTSAAGLTTYHITKKVGNQYHRAEVRVSADRAASWSAEEQIGHVVASAGKAFADLRQREAAAQAAGTTGEGDPVKTAGK
jgi:hypothetical protein